MSTAAERRAALIAEREERQRVERERDEAEERALAELEQQEQQEREEEEARKVAEEEAEKRRVAEEAENRRVAEEADLRRQAEWEEDQAELRLMTTEDRRWLMERVRSRNEAEGSRTGGQRDCWNCRVKDTVCERPGPNRSCKACASARRKCALTKADSARKRKARGTGSGGEETGKGKGREINKRKRNENDSEEERADREYVGTNGGIMAEWRELVQLRLDKLEKEREEMGREVAELKKVNERLTMALEEVGGRIEAEGREVRDWREVMEVRMDGLTTEINSWEEAEEDKGAESDTGSRSTRAEDLIDVEAVEVPEEERDGMEETESDSDSE